MARFGELGTTSSSVTDATPAALKVKLGTEIAHGKPVIEAAGVYADRSVAAPMMHRGRFSVLQGVLLRAAINTAEFAAGILFILVGAVFGLQCLGLEMGTTFRMGPSYFPAVMAVVLIGLSVAIVASAFKSVGEDIGIQRGAGSDVPVVWPVAAVLGGVDRPDFNPQPWLLPRRPARETCRSV